MNRETSSLLANMSFAPGEQGELQVEQDETLSYRQIKGAAILSFFVYNLVIVKGL